MNKNPETPEKRGGERKPTKPLAKGDPAQSEQKPAAAKAEAVQVERKPASAKGEPVQVERKPAAAKAEAVQSERKPTKTPAKAEPVQGERKPAKTPAKAGTLRGSRREITREEFESLAALQCEPEELMGYVGVPAEKLEKWCKRTYRMPLREALTMLRQDGLIAIRRASFELLMKSAPLIQQQYNRFLSAPAEEKEKDARELARRIFSLAAPAEEEMKELYEE